MGSNDGGIFNPDFVSFKTLFVAKWVSFFLFKFVFKNALNADPLGAFCTF